MPEANDKYKRLGQYFTGFGVSDLLVRIINQYTGSLNSIIDPMVGEGVMLRSAQKVFNSNTLSGIEIDKGLKNENADFQIVYGNAFSLSAIQKLPKNAFDLVITNPPFVRYQNQKHSSKIDLALVPSADEVREGLLDIVNSSSNLFEEEKNDLTKLIKGYSGLSDLTIPSVFLTSILLKPNGYLALVLPEATLGRNYSDPLLFYLLKYFDIQVIVKDESRNWFDNAQVKTELLVAKKLADARPNINSSNRIRVVETRFPNSSPSLPLGNTKTKLEIEKVVKQLVDPDYYGDANSYISAYNVDPSYYSNKISTNTKNKKWITREFQEQLGTVNSVVLSPVLSTIVNNSEWTSFDSLKVRIGQGLRTGANKFFYAQFRKKDTSTTTVKSSLTQKEYQIPNECVRTVIRSQSDLSDSFFVNAKLIKGRLIFLKDHFTTTDVKQLSININGKYKQLDNEISDYIDETAVINVNNEDSPKYIPQLSAVRTNVRLQSSAPRSWYHLPELKPRHLSNLFMPRVNSNVVSCYCTQEEVVVDANFLTIWREDNSAIDEFALLAYLNSDWVKANLEINGNILGGGALKIDRDALLSIPFPSKLLNHSEMLSELGKVLINQIEIKETLEKINSLINKSLGLKKKSELNNLLTKKIKSRSKNG